MIIWGAFFILRCFLSAAVEGAPNGSSYLQINVTESVRNATRVSRPTEEVKNASTQKPTDGTKLTNWNGSLENPRQNNTVFINTVDEDMNINSGSSNSREDGFTLHPLDESYYENNLHFFPKELVARLRAWNKTLISATRQCEKPNVGGKAIGENLEIKFAIFRPRNVDREGDFFNGEFLTFETFHPVLMRKRKGQDLVFVAYMSILELWPLLVLCFSCAALSGILVWLLDHRSNSEMFPRRFWRGIFDGMWWAIVTMTTVGYGDKAPKSWFARLFAVVWMIAGIILLSMFTAQVSSRLTTQELKGEDHLFGKKIGVPPGLYESDYVDYEMPYSIVKEIDHPINSTSELSDKKLDSVVVFHCNDKEGESWEALQFLALCEIGASLLFGDDSLMDMDAEQHFVRCIKSKIRSARKNITGLARKITQKAMESHSCRNLLQHDDILKFQFKWVYFKNLSQYLVPFGALMGAIILAFIIGSIWDYCSRQKKKRSSYRKGCTSSLKEAPSAQASFALQQTGYDDEKPIMVKSTK